MFRFGYAVVVCITVLIGCYLGSVVGGTTPFRGYVWGCWGESVLQDVYACVDILSTVEIRSEFCGVAVADNSRY